MYLGLCIKSTSTARVALVLLAAFRCCQPAIISRCYPLYTGGQVCFHQPNPPQNLSWSEAQLWCKSNGFTLPITDTGSRRTAFGNAAGFFGLSNQNLWIGANSTTDVNNWKWLNGTSFSGTVVGGDNSSKPYAYVMRNDSYIRYVAAAPSDGANHICQYPYDELWCSSNANSLWMNRKCYVKFKYNYAWFPARTYCGYNSGTLAMMDNLNDTWKWLDDGNKFWVGLRSNWWNWQDAGFSFEVTESQFRYGFPTVGTPVPQCLVSASDGNWINLDCATSLQFICQQNVNITTTTTTSTTTTTTTTSPAATITPSTTKFSSMSTTSNSPEIVPFTPRTNTPSSTRANNNNNDGNMQPFDIGGLYAMCSEMKLGVGLGVGITLAAVVIWLVIITLVILWMKRNSREPRDRNLAVMPTALELNGASINRSTIMPPDSYTFGRTYQTLHKDGIAKDDQTIYENVNYTNYA